MSELIDRQELRAAHGLGSDCHDCKRDMKSCQYDRDYSLMDFCEWLDDAPTASPWHRVEEELPDDTRDVLAVRRYGNDLEKQEVIVAHLSVIMDMKRGFDRWWNATNITHWMPFPEPPKEDA